MKLEISFWPRIGLMVVKEASAMDCSAENNINLLYLTTRQSKKSSHSTQMHSFCEIPQFQFAPFKNSPHEYKHDLPSAQNNTKPLHPLFIHAEESIFASFAFAVRGSSRGSSSNGLYRRSLNIYSNIIPQIYKTPLILPPTNTLSSFLIHSCISFSHTTTTTQKTNLCFFSNPILSIQNVSL